jgi:hypothetical protein
LMLPQWLTTPTGIGLLACHRPDSQKAARFPKIGRIIMPHNNPRIGNRGLPIPDFCRESGQGPIRGPGTPIRDSGRIGNGGPDGGGPGIWGSGPGPLDIRPPGAAMRDSSATTTQQGPQCPGAAIVGCGQCTGSGPQADHWHGPGPLSGHQTQCGGFRRHGSGVADHSAEPSRCTYSTTGRPRASPGRYVRRWGRLASSRAPGESLPGLLA